MKICTKCKQEKELTDFYKDKGQKSGLRPECKECMIIQIKIYRDNNKEKYRNYHKCYYVTHKQKIIKQQKIYDLKHGVHRRLYQKQYRKINKVKINKKIYKWQKDQLSKNFQFRILHNLRRRIGLALNGKSKSLSTMFLIGCEVDYLMYHLQNQFTKGMTWDNYGEDGWEVDHIKPCSKFNLSKCKEQIRCFHYTNLQPLWAIDNRIKGNK